MINLERIERRANSATEGPWGFSYGDRRYIADPSTDIVGEVAPPYTGQAICVFAVASANEKDAEFIASARTDVPKLIARVRELEEEQAEAHVVWEQTERTGIHTEGIRDLADALGIREGKMTADGVARFALQRVRELEAERDAYARSHLILKAIHGALTDALPSTPIPALDSFDVVELVRNIVAECERMKTFAAQSFSQMIRQEAEQMRAYGLSYEGVRKVLHEHDDGEISFGKLMDLVRAAARAMAEDMQK
jgi:hypothetical protein